MEWCINWGVIENTQILSRGKGGGYGIVEDMEKIENTIITLGLLQGKNLIGGKTVSMDVL